MKCLMVREQIKAYTDGELGRIAKWRVTRHLARCVECSMEAKAMADLTNQVRNAGDIPAPDGLREKVLGKIDFNAPSKANGTWAYATKPVAVVGVLVFAVVAAAVFGPMFTPAKERSRMVVARQRQVATKPLREPSVANVAPAKKAQQIRAAKDYDLTVQAKLRNDTTTANATVNLKNYEDYLHNQRKASSRVPSQVNPATPMMIIKTAELTVLVKDFEEAGDSTVRVAKSVGGYVTDSSASSDAGSPTSGTMTLKVPVGSFERAIERLGELGKVTGKGISGEDVTGEVVDLESRLRNMRAEERQYLAIMNRANRVNDIVTVSNELYRVREEIETTVGRIKYLKTAADMSTIELSLTEKEKPKPAPQGAFMKSLTGALASLLGTLSAIMSALIWLVVYSPFWALLVAGVVYLRRKGQPAKGESGV